MDFSLSLIHVGSFLSLYHIYRYVRVYTCVYLVRSLLPVLFIHILVIPCCLQ